MTSLDSLTEHSYRPPATARFLLLQMRNRQDRMRGHEVRCFARALNIDISQAQTFDLVNDSLTKHAMRGFDMVLLGGAGEYSATSDEPWMERAMDSLREVHAAGKPTFASCWGFQAMARALGGRVINDTSIAEVGTLPIQLTDDGQSDVLFGQLPASFDAPMGHEDHVVQLPEEAVHLARSGGVEYQAFSCGQGRIYCTQFHPELTAVDLVERVKAYPEYLERIAGVTLEEFTASLRETPLSGSLMQRFAQLAFQ